MQKVLWPWVIFSGRPLSSVGTECSDQLLLVHVAIYLRAELIRLEPGKGPQKVVRILDPSCRRIGQCRSVSHIGQDVLGERVLTLEGKMRQGKS